VVLRAALEATVTDLGTRYGPDPAKWRWGEVHQAVFANPFMRSLPVIGRLFTFRIDSPGDDTTIDRGVPSRGNYESMHGPGFRAVYDLANLDRSQFVLAPGQSGNPLSAHAGDFLQRWRDNDMIMLGPIVPGPTTPGSGTPGSGTPGSANATTTASIRLLP
jgi:penicillin amidase